MQKRTIPLIAGSAILGLFAIFITNMYLGQQRQEIEVRTQQKMTRMQEMQASVLVANRDIPKGTTIAEGMFEPKVIPKEYLQPQAVTYPERIIGMVTVAPISPGEQITLSKLVSSKQVATGGSLAMATPMGKRAISIPVDNISSLMGMIKPGDYVDVIGHIPIPVKMPDGRQEVQIAVMPLFQNVLVLTVGRSMVAESPSDSRYGAGEDAAVASMITLALSPQESNLIAFVQEQGKIRFVLRSPADSRIEPIQAASWESLFQYLMPQAPGTQPEEAQAQEAGVLTQEKPREVEVYRGLKKEIIYISN